MDTPGTAKPPVKGKGLKGIEASIKAKPMLWLAGVGILALGLILYFHSQASKNAAAAAQEAALADSLASQPQSPGFFTGGDSGELSDFPTMNAGGGDGGGGGGGVTGGGLVPLPSTLPPGADTITPGNPTTGGGAPTAPPVHHAIAAAATPSANALNPAGGAVPTFTAGVGNSPVFKSNAGFKAAVKADQTQASKTTVTNVSPNAKPGNTKAPPKKDEPKKSKIK